MKKVVKVLMFVFRNNNGKKEFFVLHRKRGDRVVLTGHVGDVFKGESLEQAALREVKEELGVDPVKIVDLKDSVEVEIKKGKEEILSREHAFLIEIPNKEVHFLEADEKHQWHSLKELSDVLTYSNQKQFLDLCQICDKPL